MYLFISIEIFPFILYLYEQVLCIYFGESINYWNCNLNSDEKYIFFADNFTKSERHCTHKPPVTCTRRKSCHKVIVQAKHTYNSKNNEELSELNNCEYRCLTEIDSHNFLENICKSMKKHVCNSATSLEIYTIIMFIGSLLFAHYIN